MKQKNKPRAWTEAEVRAKFLTIWASYVQYWEKEARAPTARDKLDGLAFSLLAMLDGSNAGIPGFVIAPAPHKNDRAYCIKLGENYYHEAPKVKCDIGGGLHEQIHDYLRKMRGDS